MKLVRALRLLTEGLSAARSFGQPRIELEAIALRLILAGEDPSLDALAMRVSQLEAGAPRPTAAVEPAPSPAVPPVPPAGAGTVASGAPAGTAQRAAGRQAERTGG